MSVDGEKLADPQRSPEDGSQEATVAMSVPTTPSPEAPPLSPAPDAVPAEDSDSPEGLVRSYDYEAAGVQPVLAEGVARLSLSVGDGFKFGCGFLMAAATAALLLLLAASLAFFVGSLAGLSVPAGI